MYDIGICDDEKGTCAEIEKWISDYAEGNHISVETEVWFSGEALCSDLKEKHRFDLIFLDIELLGMSGVEAGSYIRNELEDYHTHIVFISSKTNYAMSLFKIQPMDFLVKPIGFDDIKRILDRSIYLIEKENLFFEYVSGKKIFRVMYKEIMYFCGDRRKIVIVTQRGRQEFYGKMTELLKALPSNFVMIHHSYIINQNYVSEYSYERIHLVNGDELAISRSYRKDVREKILVQKMEGKGNHV